MKLFRKKKASSEDFATKSQPVLISEALERGEVLDMFSMLFDYGVGNHTGVIARVRKMYEKKGLGYDYVKTEMVKLISKKTKKEIEIARYYIPEKVNER